MTVTLFGIEFNCLIAILARRPTRWPPTTSSTEAATSLAGTQAHLKVTVGSLFQCMTQTMARLPYGPLESPLEGLKVDSIQWTANHMLTMRPRALFPITRPGVKTTTGERLVVMQRLAEGYSNRQISDELGLPLLTVAKIATQHRKLYGESSAKETT
ncbi:DNA-binding response regulator [Alcaligenes aquatilis]|uniref:DNA-binding response regulator n=1 Tax=Alcaligenes aquatilis TaxID=323284 RepID=A0A3G2HX29_9BURK|nr:DNA-binding response regulator [Alcaligenes aquatilis]